MHLRPQTAVLKRVRGSLRENRGLDECCGRRWPTTWRLWNNRPSVLLLPTACVPPTPLTTTTSFDNGLTQAVKRARCCPFDVRCGYPGFKPCKRRLWYPTSSNRPQLCQRPSDYHSGTFSPALRSRTSNSRLSRTRWPTIRTTSNLDGPALMYVKHSTGD